MGFFCKWYFKMWDATLLFARYVSGFLKNKLGLSKFGDAMGPKTAHRSIGTRMVALSLSPYTHGLGRNDHPKNQLPNKDTLPSTKSHPTIDVERPKTTQYWNIEATSDKMVEIIKMVHVVIHSYSSSPMTELVLRRLGVTVQVSHTIPIVFTYTEAQLNS